MKKNKLIIAELLGVFVVIAGTLFLRNIYALSGNSTLGVVFGSVNLSVWEKSKGISISYFLFGLIELLCLKPYFRRFVVSKVFGLCAALASFLVIDSFFEDLSPYGNLTLIIAVVCGFLCSYILYSSQININQFFAPACFLLMLIFIMTFSFTVFPPKLPVFRDPMTGCYGVAQPSFDMGAVALNS